MRIVYNIFSRVQTIIEVQSINFSLKTIRWPRVRRVPSRSPVPPEEISASDCRQSGANEPRSRSSGFQTCADGDNNDRSSGAEGGGQRLQLRRGSGRGASDWRCSCASGSGAQRWYGLWQCGRRGTGRRRGASAGVRVAERGSGRVLRVACARTPVDARRRARGGRAPAAGERAARSRAPAGRAAIAAGRVRAPGLARPGARALRTPNA